MHMALKFKVPSVGTSSNIWEMISITASDVKVHEMGSMQSTE